MTIKLHRLSQLSNQRRLETIVLALLLLLSSLSSVEAQSRKRITSIWTITTAAGSTVVVASDVSLHDYEAYRRGDRFYLKIPQADLPSSARGSLLGHGFDDVQIQRFGDGIIVSFHLQPGTDARVQETGTHLNVVFSLPGRPQKPRTADETGSNRVRPRRTQEVAVASAPSRHESTSSSKTPRKFSRAPQGSADRRAERNTRSQESPASNSSKQAKTESAAQKTPPLTVSSPSPAASKTTAAALPTVGPGPANVAAASASPAPSSAKGFGSVSASATPTPPIPAQSAAANQPTSWAARVHYYKEWAKLNPWPLLIFGLILLCLVVLVISSRLGRRRATAATAKTPPRSPQTIREALKTQAAAAARTGPEQSNVPKREVRSTESSRAWDARLPQPNSAVREEEEREVFEL